VEDFQAVQGQPALPEQLPEEVAAGRAGPAGDADGATLEIRDGGDGAVLEQVLAHLEGGGRVLRIARGDAHGADDLEGHALLEGVEHAGAEPGDHHVERSEEHTSELQSRFDLVCRLLLEKKKKKDKLRE